MTITNEVDFTPVLTGVEEKDHQKKLFDWLLDEVMIDYPEIHPLFFSTLNGIPIPGSPKVKSKIINSMKAQGMTVGVPDTLFLSGRGGYLGLVLELKRPEVKGEANGGLSESQMEFLDAARAEGYMAETAWGYNEARKIIKDYLALPRTQDLIYAALKYLDQGKTEAAKMILDEIALTW